MNNPSITTKSSVPDKYSDHPTSIKSKTTPPPTRSTPRVTKKKVHILTKEEQEKANKNKNIAITIIVFIVIGLILAVCHGVTRPDSDSRLLVNILLCIWTVCVFCASYVISQI